MSSHSWGSDGAFPWWDEGQKCSPPAWCLPWLPSACGDEAGVGKGPCWGGHHAWSLQSKLHEIPPLLQAPLQHSNVFCGRAQSLPPLAAWGIFGKLGVSHEFLIHPPTVVPGHNTCLHPRPAQQLRGLTLNQCSVYHFNIKYNHWRLLLIRSWPCVCPGGW